MAVLLVFTSFFVTTFLLQLIIWRIRLPQRQVRALLLLYLITPIVMTLAAYSSGHLPFSPAELARVWVLYAPVSLAYIALYAAIELSSPTLVIISSLDAAGEQGCTEPELLERFRLTVGAEMNERFDIMQAGGLIRKTHGDVIEITPRGRTYANIFEFAARVFGFGKGG